MRRHIVTLTTSLTVNNVLLYSSTIEGTFYADGQYVHGAAGMATFAPGSGTTWKTTKNVYDTAFVTTESYYRVNRTITTKNYGIIYLKQYVYCTPSGATGAGDSRSGGNL